MNTTSTNIQYPERLASVLMGSLLLIDTLANTKHRKSKALTAGYLLFRGITGNCVVYKAMGKESRMPSKNINIRLEMMIEKPRNTVYAAWRKLENLPLFMTHLSSVKEVYDNISEWKVNTVGNILPITWRACIVKDVPGEMISWRSLPDAAIDNSGKIEFRDVTPGVSTHLYINISYQAPLGFVGTALANFFNPALEKTIKEDIFKFKEYIEVGGEKMVWQQAVTL